MRVWRTKRTIPTPLFKRCKNERSKSSFHRQKNRKKKRRYDKELYKLRYKVECFFHDIKRFRRVATRFEKKIETFKGFVLWAAAFQWIIWGHPLASVPACFIVRLIGLENGPTILLSGAAENGLITNTSYTGKTSTFLKTSKLSSVPACSACYIQAELLRFWKLQNYQVPPPARKLQNYQVSPKSSDG